jgi:hypothetical protein
MRVLAGEHKDEEEENPEREPPRARHPYHDAYLEKRNI